MLRRWLVVLCLFGCGNGAASTQTPAAIDAGADSDLPTGEPGPQCEGIDVFGNACTGVVCHFAGPGNGTGLDLQSPGVAGRLVGVASSCEGRLYIDPADPTASFLVEKLTQEAPACGGSRMPFNGYLTDAQIACIEDWIYDVAAE